MKTHILCSVLAILAFSEMKSQTASDTAAATNLFEQAFALQRSARYDTAIVLYDKSEELYTAANMIGGQIRCRNKKSECLKSKGSYDKATAVLQITPDIEQSLLKEEPLLAAERLVMLGSILRQQGKYDTALVVVRSADRIPRGKSADAVDLEWDICSLFGEIYSSTGEHDSALAYFSCALGLFPAPEGEQRMKISSTYNGMAGIYETHGDYQKALDYFTRSLETRRLVLGEKHPDIAGLYNNIAAIQMRVGDYDLALEYYLKSLAIMAGTVEPDHPSFGIRYNNIAMVYRSRGEFDKALDAGRKSKEIFLKKLGAKHPNVAGVINNIGRTYADMGQYDRALESYQEALSIWEEKLGPKHPSVTQSYFNIGEAYGKLGDAAKARVWLEKSLTVRRETLGEKNAKVGQSHNALGAVFAGSNNLDTALQHYQQGIISLVETFGNADIHANPDTLKSSSDLDLLVSLTGKGEALRQKYEIEHQLPDLKSSLDCYEHAAWLVENIRRGFGTEGSKIQLGQTAFNGYQQGTITARRLYEATHDGAYLSAAFSFAERSKAGTLWDAITESNARAFAGIPESLLTQESALRVDLTYHETQIQRGKEKKGKADKAKIAQWESTLFDIHRRYESLIERFDRNYPEYHSLKLDTKVVSLPEVRRQLDDKSALLEFVAGDSSVSVFAITRTRCVLKSHELHASLPGLVKQFRHSIQSIDDRSYRELGRRLFAELIGPVRDELRGKKKLYIVADGILNYLPFEALLTAGGKTASADFSALPYLVRDFDISYHISSTLLFGRKIVKSHAGGEEFVGIAPVFSDKPLHASAVYATAVRSAASEDDSEKPVMRSITVGGEQLTELKESENEVKNIVKLFEANKRKGTAFLHSAASESEFKSAKVGSSRFVHVATHGIIQEDSPKLSALVFAMPEKGSWDDGVLYAGEVYNLKLNADLVVLSACESGLGKVAKGEGILGLTRGFLYAGAKNLLVSLWQVADKSTADLMVEFYRNVLKGQSLPSALRNAKLTMIKEKKFAHPVEWSPFVLMGK
ncbi:MAG: CHAT domain-containing tetratricopeptide repeat protein [Bacteroidota bacterium]